LVLGHQPGGAGRPRSDRVGRDLAGRAAALGEGGAAAESEAAPASRRPIAPSVAK
jgi:hypothetical protein